VALPPTIVAAAADCHQQAVHTRKINTLNYVGDSGAAGNERRTSVDHAIPDFAGLVIIWVCRLEQCAAQACFERFN
jgi:hypothetical protein